MRAVDKIRHFILSEDHQQSMPYSQAWARPIPRESWQYISDKLRANISKNSHVDF
jgi:hypothetical protein